MWSLLDLAWEQWSEMGLSGAAPKRREERATDPDALLLFTLHVARHDPRRFDEVLDWPALNTPLISTTGCATSAPTPPIARSPKPR